MSIVHPKVSVIIPTYNFARLLPRTIKSVLNQTLQDFELIIVDDGSTDDTREVVGGFVGIDPRVRYVYQKNSGAPARPTNTGIQESDGEYIAILQHDDEWFPEKIEKQVSFFENSKNPNPGFIGCHAVIVKPDGSTRKQLLTKSLNLARDLLGTNVVPYPSAVMVKKEVFRDIGLFDEKFRIADDWDMWLRIAQKYRFDFVDSVLFKYHIHGNNITRVASATKNARELEHFIQKHRGLYATHPNLLAKQLIAVGSYYILADDLVVGRKYLHEAFYLHKAIRYLFRLLVAYLGRNAYLSIRTLSRIYRVRSP